MCYECYSQAGKPIIVNEKTKVAALLIKEVYKYAAGGGNAHIVIDDWNLEDEHIDWCIKANAEDKHEDLSDEEIAATNNCLVAIKKLTVKERYSALAIHERFIIV